MKRFVILLALVGCYRPGSEIPCTVMCNALGECPDGLACNATGQCALAGGGCLPDAASPIDSSPDDAHELRKLDDHHRLAQGCVGHGHE